MATAQQVIDRARIPLNDNGKVRYQDAALLSYLNEGLLMLRRHRPDLWVGRFGATVQAASLNDVVEIADIYLAALSDYVTARAETINADMASEGRAMSFMRLCQGAI